jgi:hypothetical protein
MKTYDIKERDAYFKLRESRGCEQYIPDEIKYNDYLHSSYDKTYFDKLKNTAKNIATCTSRWFDDDSIYSYGSWYKTDKEKHQEDEMLNEMFKLTYNAKTGKITSSEDRVLGGDDKCGVALALATAFRLKNEPMKILFTVGEEIGCVGIKAFIKEHADWFKDVKYSITIDRRGSDNLLKWSAGKQNCSDKFCAQLALHGVLAGIPVKVESGMLADVVYIRDIVPEAANISAGYYNPHSTTEYIEFEAMCFILEWLRRIILYTKL